MRPLAVVGVVAVAAGFGALLSREVAGTLDLSAAVVTAIGALGVIQGARYAYERRGLTRRRRDLGEPERRVPATVPGSDLDDRIARRRSPRRRGRNSRDRVRERVRDVAVRATARRRNCSRERAADLVDEGAWTDDGTAAAFLSSTTSYPLRDRLRAGVTGYTVRRLGAVAAVDAVERLNAGPTADSDPETTPVDPTAGAGGDGGGAEPGRADG